jgi:hypothetical protein
MLITLLERFFEMEDLRNLQVTVQCLIGKLIEKPHAINKKTEILKEIDACNSRRILTFLLNSYNNGL